MARTIEDTPTSPYAVLGVSRHATPEQIKHAYRDKAKAAHPDAGGSVAAMARVNEAYSTLSDAAARRSYDEFHAPSSGGQGHHRPQARHPQYKPQQTANRPAPKEYVTQHPRGAQPSDTMPSDHITRSRTVWARNSAWELLRFSLPTAVAAIIVSRYAPTYVGGAVSLFALHLITFIPVYALVLSIIFLTNPPLRLVYADLRRGHPTTKHERTNALALFLAFFPLAVVWALVQ